MGKTKWDQILGAQNGLSNQEQGSCKGSGRPKARWFKGEGKKRAASEAKSVGEEKAEAAGGAPKNKSEKASIRAGERPETTED